MLRFKKIFARGGLNRQKYTFPALFFSLIRLTVFVNYPPAAAAAEEVKQEEPLEGEEQEPEPIPTVQVSQARIFKNLSEIINALQPQYPELALRLNLQAA